jgi:hypothetical protein
MKIKATKPSPQHPSKTFEDGQNIKNKGNKMAGT